MDDRSANAAARTFADSRLVGGGPALKLAILQLSVANQLYQSAPDGMVVSTVEARPIAAPAMAATAFRGATVAFDGSRSVNPNAASAGSTGLAWRWALLSRPAGSVAALAGAATANPTLVPDVYGLYVAQLIAGDGILDSRPATVVFEAVPRPPVAAASAASPVQLGKVATLDGSGSTDPDGNALSFAWTLTARPQGSSAILANAAAAVASFKPDVAGDYAAQLIVRDAYNSSAPVAVSVLAKGGFSFDALPPQSVALGGRRPRTAPRARA